MNMFSILREQMTAFVYNMHNSQRRVPVGQAIPSGETGEGADSAGGRPERTPAAGEQQGLAQAERETAPALCGPVFRTGHFFLFENAVDHILTGSPLIVKPEETLNVAAIIDAFYLSAAESREVRAEEIVK